MNWVSAEIKRRKAREARETAAAPAKSAESATASETHRIKALWDRIEAANSALPAELKLQHQLDKSADPAPGKPPFVRWLHAPNGAGLGFNGEGVRYHWPQHNQRRSNNFWLRWDESMGYVVSRRVGKSWSGARAVVRKFKESSVEHMLKCLVTGVRIKPRSVRARRFWFF